MGARSIGCYVRHRQLPRRQGERRSTRNTARRSIAGTDRPTPAPEIGCDFASNVVGWLEMPTASLRRIGHWLDRKQTAGFAPVRTFALDASVPVDLIPAIPRRQHESGPSELPPWFSSWPHSESAAYCLKVVQRLQMDAKTTA
jgi:hypothetical protein